MCIARITKTNVYRDQEVKVEEHGRPGIQNVGRGRCYGKTEKIMHLYTEVAADIFS